VLIGANPYQHDAVFDPLTGGSVMSPVNRFIWLALLVFSAPVLWWRRADLADALRRLWPVALLFVWFIVTTRWAIDPDASSRRLFLYIVDLLICLAVTLGLKDARRLHRALATACAIVVMIDLGSWIVAPAASMTDIGLAAIHTHKNTLGAVMLLTGLICAPYTLAQQSLMGRMFWGAITIASVVLLIASKSKTSLGILIAAATRWSGGSAPRRWPCSWRRRSCGWPGAPCRDRTRWRRWRSSPSPSGRMSGVSPSTSSVCIPGAGSDSAHSGT